MIRIDKMAQQLKEIRQALQPVFILAVVEVVKAGWVVVFHLWHEREGKCEKITSFCPDMESVDKRIGDMRQEYPSNDKPVVIIDNLPEGG